ncbi:MULTISPECIES: BadF/BadG/BcrA/BcrD ATPase family protein [unclassified Undibacterium]|uniref:BadF/BadG/BcrA/BcrD ATPase family protein n=1 Tax=unclassified Undibacterium TaxID=2630295 RepID=UPI00339A0E88
MKTNKNSMGEKVIDQYQYLIGVDGGGTGTRVRLVQVGGTEVGQGSAGPSGLMHGIESAWQSILAATRKAFFDAGLAMPPLREIAAGCGLAGIHNKQWATEFYVKNPGFGSLAIGTDAETTLLGAHQGAAGAIIALGTGSAGEVMLVDGIRREVGGWGFPSSDEASGAWLGLRAINHIQHVLDGRSPEDAFSAALLQACAGPDALTEAENETEHKANRSNTESRDLIFNWLAKANQTNYAQLAPVVIAHAPTTTSAGSIMLAAGSEVAKMASALDPSGLLPIALCGGLAEPMLPYLPLDLLPRIVKPKSDSAAGALILIQRQINF